MTNIKILANGKLVAYVKNDEEGRKTINRFLQAALSLVYPDVRIKPLRSGKVAIHLKNDTSGRRLVSALLSEDEIAEAQPIGSPALYVVPDRPALDFPEDTEWGSHDFPTL